MLGRTVGEIVVVAKYRLKSECNGQGRGWRDVSGVKMECLGNEEEVCVVSVRPTLARTIQLRVGCAR